MSKKILKVTIKRMLDTDPDLSFLGEYGNTPKSDYAIDRDHNHEGGAEGDRYDSREYRYFNPNHENYAGEPEEDIQKYCVQDYERMEAYNAQQWCMVGVRAEAEIQLTGDTTQRLTSGGLWGIESDSEDSYFKEVAGDELGQLREQLTAAGFSKRAIDAAFENIEEVQE